MSPTHDANGIPVYPPSSVDGEDMVEDNGQVEQLVPVQAIGPPCCPLIIVKEIEHWISVARELVANAPVSLQ